MSTATSVGVTMFGFELSETGIREANPGKPPTEKQWEQLGEYLKWFEGSIHWLIGAWVAYGEAHFGERASQAVDATGWKLATIKQDVWVHNSVPEDVRDPDLEWSHHRVVADLPKPQQKQFLKKAKSEGLSVAALQREVNKTKHPEKTECWLLVCCTDEEDRESLSAALAAQGRSVKVP